MHLSLNPRLSEFTDEEIMEEKARRNANSFYKKYGFAFKFGEFADVFHEGRYKKTDARPKERIYLSPGRLVNETEF